MSIEQKKDLICTIKVFPKECDTLQTLLNIEVSYFNLTNMQKKEHKQIPDICIHRAIESSQTSSPLIDQHIYRIRSIHVINTAKIKEKKI